MQVGRNSPPSRKGEINVDYLTLLCWEQNSAYRNGHRLVEEARI